MKKSQKTEFEEFFFKSLQYLQTNFFLEIRKK